MTEPICIKKTKNRLGSYCKTVFDQGVSPLLEVGDSFYMTLFSHYHYSSSGNMSSVTTEVHFNSVNSCEAVWWMVLANILLHYCIISSHCTESFYHLGLNCHKHHTSSTDFIIRTFTLCIHNFCLLFYFQSTPSVILVLLIKTRQNWWCCQKHCVHCFLSWGE